MSRIAIVTPKLDKYSETFIRAHIERLPAEVHVLYGGRFPTQADDGQCLVPERNLAQRAWFRLQQQLRGLPGGYEARQRKAVERFLQEHRIQAVLAEYGPTGVAMMDICQDLGIPLVVHFHGYDAFKEDVLARFGDDYRILFGRCAGLVAGTEFMKRRLVSLGASERLISVNPCGVDMSHFRPTNPDSNSPTLLAVGRFVNKKAPYLTLLAFHRAAHSEPDTQLVMVGDGPLWEACVRMANVLGIADKVEFVGVTAHAEVAGLMQKARGLVQHSITALDGDSESFGIVFVEAGASGLPVVGTRHDGIPEVVVDGETGILVDERDVDGMAQAMIRLATDPQLAAQMGQAGRKRVETHYSMEKSIKGLSHVIESAIDSAA